jgi:DNA-binding PadR family transcriptional regulator
MFTSLTRLERAILGLLLEGPRTGYDLRTIFATTPIGNFSGGPGAIYPALDRLAARGLVRRGPRGAVGRPMVAFRLAPAGRRAIVGWLRETPTRDDVIWDVDDQMLKLAFMAFVATPADVDRFLAAYARETRAYLRELRTHRAALDLPPVARLALDHGIAIYQARARWAVRARRSLPAPSRPGGAS